MKRDPADKLNVERIYNEPNLSGITVSNIGWSPNSKLLCYIRGEGERNELWAFDVDSKKRRLLFDYGRLPGSAEASRHRHWTSHGGRHRHQWHTRQVRPAATLTYQWAPRGEQLLVSACGGAPRLLDLATDTLLPLGHDTPPVSDVKFSPDGRFISFVRAFDLFLIDTSTGVESALTCGSSEGIRSATPDSMGDLLVDAGHWWSPDSARIAYLQTDERAVPYFALPDLLSSRGVLQWERYPTPGDPDPIIALRVASQAGHLWIDTRPWPGAYLVRVAWLPDARHLALQLLNREQNALCLVLADAQTGATCPILTEQNPSWINVGDDLRFFADGRHFLWSTEGDSYRQLYIYDMRGKERVRLTARSEAFITVEGLDERNKAVYYLVFPEPYTDGCLKRVSYRREGVAFVAGPPTVLTPAPGTHFPTLSPDFAYFADHFSTALQPPRLDLYRTDGSLVATIEENRVADLAGFDLRLEFPPPIRAAKLGHPSDEMPLYSKLIPPSPLEKGRRYPVIVYVYGGPLPGGLGLARNVVNYWSPVPWLWLQLMAQRGFGVFSLDNRGSNAAPRGHAWETPIHRRLGKVELADQLEGLNYLKSLEWVDPGRIGILGGSFGGFMTLNAMLRAPGSFKAGVAFAPVTSWSEFDSVYTERYMDLPSRNGRGYHDTALPGHARNLTGRLLLIHGTGDETVHLQNSIQLTEALLQAGKDFELMLIPGQGHYSFFAMGQDAERLWNRITNFFEENL